jgi:hypothetical protein
VIINTSKNEVPGALRVEAIESLAKGDGPSAEGAATPAATKPARGRRGVISETAGDGPLPVGETVVMRRIPAARVTEAEIEALASLDLIALRSLWQDRIGEPPKLRSPELLRHLLAWHLQVEAFGDLDRETRRRLRARGPVEAEGHHLGLGAILRRNWQGRRIEVVVESDGFRWEGRVFASLSSVARAATGTRWNGPRFFGLRTGEAPT